MIFGVTGRLASGKDTFANFMVKEGLEKLSLSDKLREILAKEHIEATRENLAAKGNELRKQFGPGHIADLVAHEIDGDCVIVSLRNPAEVEIFKKLPDFKLIAIEATQEDRFKMFNDRLGQMSDAEPMSLEDFQAVDDSEESDDPNEMNLTKVMAMADVVIENNGDLEALRKKAIGLLK